MPTPPRPAPPAAPRQRVRPVQERSRRKIDAILDATGRLIGRHGVDAVTMVAIAEEAGVPPPTVYHYFENRLAVFAAIVQRTADEVDAALIPLIEAQMAGGQPDVRMLLQHLYRAYAAQPGYLALLSTLRAEPALQAEARRSNERVAGAIAGMLVQVAPLPPARARRVAFIVSETCDAVLHAALASTPRVASELVNEAAVMVEALFRHYASLDTGARRR